MNSNPYVTKVELGVELDKQNQKIDLKVNNLELGVNGSIDTTTDTTSLPDGVYLTQIPGTYTNAGNIVVKEGYYTLLRKTGDVWSLESEVKMPMQNLDSINSDITALKNKNGGQVTINETKNVDGGQVFNFVNNSSVNKWNLPNFPDGYYKDMLVVVDDAIWESLANNNTEKPSSTSTKWKKVNIATEVDQKFNINSNHAIANKTVTPLADALDSFIQSEKVNISTVDSKLGYIKNDGTIVVGNENKYIEITDLASFKYLNYEGYKAVANANSQELYSSVLAVKSDGSKETLLGMFNTSKGQGAQVKESFNILIPENTTKLLIDWSVWGIAEDIRLSFSNEILVEKDAVKKYIDENLSPLEIVFSEPLNLKFDKNYAYDLIELFSSKNISISSDFENNKIGNVSILKFKGGSLTFDSDIIIDNGSDIYNPNIGNMIYVIWEYQSARAIIKNSNNNSIVNRLITQTFFADFNVPNSSYDNYTPNVGTKPTVDYGSFTIVDNKLKSLSNADNLLNFQLQNYNDFEFTTNVVVANMLNIGIHNTMSSNVSIRKSENIVVYTNDAGQPIITSYVFPSNNNFKVRGVFKNGYFSLFINDNIVLSNVKLKIIGVNFFLDFYNSASYANGEFDDIEIKEFL